MDLSWNFIRKPNFNKNQKNDLATTSAQIETDGHKDRQNITEKIFFCSGSIKQILLILKLKCFSINTKCSKHG